MAKFIDIVSGAISRVSALVTSSGASDADKLVATGGDGKLDLTLMPDGIGPDTKSVLFYENASAGDLINLYNDAGVLKARKADASGGVAKQCDGYVKSAVTAGQNGTVYFDGVITGLTGLTIGAKYYLSKTTAGSLTNTAFTDSGYIWQGVGKASSATELIFEASDPIVL